MIHICSLSVVSFAHLTFVKYTKMARAICFSPCTKILMLKPTAWILGWVRGWTREDRSQQAPQAVEVYVHQPHSIWHKNQIFNKQMNYISKIFTAQNPHKSWDLTSNNQNSAILIFSKICDFTVCFTFTYVQSYDAKFKKTNTM